MSDDLLGHVIGGRFLILEALGEGGMGSVYRGVQLDGSRDVAIKILRPELAEDRIVRARFQREAQMAAQVNHPNAVRMLDSGVDDDLPYMVMELIEGRELFEVLAEKRRLAQGRAVAIAVQVCSALAMAHDRGIIHRDLKPENVMLVRDPESTYGERVKLLDFGVAKQVGPERPAAAASLTLSGSIIGTPAYMSPEQCRGDALDARSDVYACGALLYHLVTGRTPFDDDSPLETLFRHMHEPPRPPTDFVRNLDPALCATILKALAKRPEDRQPSAHALGAELAAMLPRLEAEAGGRITASSAPALPWAATLPQVPLRDVVPATPVRARERRPAARERAAWALRWAAPLLAGLAVTSAAIWLSGVMSRLTPRVDSGSVMSSSGPRRALYR